jgi:hypothetical protein
MTATEPIAPYTWCTIADVATVTGRTVDAQTRNIAANAVELHIGLIEAVSRPLMSRRDAYWLRQAVAYQAAWITQTPDYLDRNAIASLTQDGESATAGNPDWLTLAPLARKALKRLSFRGPRVVGAVTNDRGIVDEDATNSYRSHRWSSVTGGITVDASSSIYDGGESWSGL